MDIFRYDIEGLCEDIGVSFNGIYLLYTEYFAEMKGNIQECKTLLISKDWDKLEREVHNMKGISVNLNVTDVYTACANLDIRLRTNKYENTIEYIENICKLFNTAENDIREFFRQKQISI